MKYKTLSALSISIVVAIIIQACAGMGSMRGDNYRIYHKGFDEMVKITRDAIQKEGYSMVNINNKAGSHQSTRITFSNRSTAGQQMVSSMQANVIVAKVDTAEAVEIRVTNPDYSYGTPTDQRIDYARVLFAKIDELLE